MFGHCNQELIMENSKQSDAFLWADPNSGEVSYLPVTDVVDVTGSCSKAFNDGGRIAFLEYGVLPAGGKIVRLKTRFKDCPSSNFTVSSLYSYAKMDQDEFERVLWSSALDFVRNWGIELKRLSELVFQHIPLPPIALDAEDFFGQVQA
jgi:hypothetical protein